MYIYGLMLTDYRSEFSLVIDDLASPVNLNDSPDVLMNVYLNHPEYSIPRGIMHELAEESKKHTA